MARQWPGQPTLTRGWTKRGAPRLPPHNTVIAYCARARRRDGRGHRDQEYSFAFTPEEGWNADSPEAKAANIEDNEGNCWLWTCVVAAIHNIWHTEDRGTKETFEARCATAVVLRCDR